MTDRDALRDALAEALHSLCRMHTTQHGVDAHYDSADAILAHPAVLAALHAKVQP